MTTPNAATTCAAPSGDQDRCVCVIRGTSQALQAVLETAAADVRLTLTAEDGRHLALHLHLQHPITARLEERAAPGQPAPRPARFDHRHLAFLPPGRSPGFYPRSDDDLLERAYAFAWRVAGLSGWKDAGAAAKARIRGFLAQVARVAVHRCDPVAWAVARRFGPVARLHVLRALAADPSGRVAQAAAACPGLLLATAFLEARGGEAATGASTLLGDVARGAPLGALANEAAVRVLIALAEHDEVQARRLVPSLGGRSEDELIHRLSLLIRRASPRVVPGDLCGLPPPWLVPEDVPSGRDNPTWYAVTRLVWDQWLLREVPGPAWSFLSRTAVDWWRQLEATHPAQDVPLRKHGARLAKWCFLGDPLGWPHRHASVPSVLRRLRPPAANDTGPGLGPACRLGQVMELARKLDLGTVTSVEGLDPDHPWLGGSMALPPFPLRLPRIKGVELTAAGTPLELAALGQDMENCVATWCGKLAGGQAWIFGGTVAGEAAAVEVQRHGNGWTVYRALGRKNTPLGLAAIQALRTWVKALNESSPGQDSGPRRSHATVADRANTGQNGRRDGTDGPEPTAACPSEEREGA